MEENLSSPLVADGSVQAIKFSLATFDEICKYSINDCPITHQSQLTNPFLGLPLESGKCESCGTAETGKCEGHFGYIELPVPVYHPSHITELKQILSLICLKCMRMKERVKRNVDVQKASSVSCQYCLDAPQISFKEMKTADGASFLEMKMPSRTRLRDGLWNFLDKFGYHYGDTFCRSLLPFEVLNILKEIPEETKRRLSARGYFPQEGFILQYLPVPPNCLLVPEISDGKSIMSSDISISLLRRVLNKIELIRRSRSGSPNFESHEVESNDLQSAIVEYMHLRGTTKAPHDITRKLTTSKEASDDSSKQWLEKMRTLFIRKGSGFSSRSVITGDAYISINQIGLPSEIAKRITFEERVTDHNLQHLQGMVDNGLCVTYIDGNATYAIARGSKGHTHLKVGQVINRKIVDGDLVFINRPPSTHKHSLQAFSVYIHEDHTVKINPLICAPLGADFDGDCVHIFYPQSLAAKAEVKELFSVDQQLLSSHSGQLNLQLVNDSVLSLKLMSNTSFLTRATAQQLAMFVSSLLPPPAVIRAPSSGPLWTLPQILQSALPPFIDCFGERHFINQSEILKLDFNRDLLQSSVTDIINSIFIKRGPKEALNFFNILQPLLMETLSLEGFSVNLRDFYVPKAITADLQKSVQEISGLLSQLRLAYNELLELQVENNLKTLKLRIIAFLLKVSSLGTLIDSKSDSAIMKVVQQLGFLGLQLFDRGKLYSKALVQDVFQLFVSKYPSDGIDYPSEAYGLVKNSFFHGLNPYEELVHSISSREVIVRSSRGLTEPGTLFKNLMAILRDVVICYDGTVRNVCSNSIIQFEYGLNDEASTSSAASAGEPVGVLAATSISNPAYKAVLDSSQSTNSSWELMKEILLCKVNYRNDVSDRRVILYLNECCCGRKFCKENAAWAVRNCLKKVTLKDCSVDFSIEYQKQILSRESSEAATGLVGHIHLDKERLAFLDRSIDEIFRKCQDVISSYGRKKSHLFHLFRRIALSASECCGAKQFPCLQFSYSDRSAGPRESLEQVIHIMADTVCPILLDTIVKGDSRVNAANIIWIGHDATSWVRNSRKTIKGELALEVVIEKAAARQNGDAFRTALDACLPVMHLIDTKRSIPYGIQQIKELLGISCAFDQSVQRLTTSIRMVSKGVLKQHLILVGNSMTCTGNLIGFNMGGFKALFRSLKVRVPFTEGTLFTPMKCFEKAAENFQRDSLESIVSSCAWGKHVAVGTGSHFQVLWDKHQMTDHEDVGKDVYEFLALLRTSDKGPKSGCLGDDVDDLADDTDCLSPEPNVGCENPTFEDFTEAEYKYENNTNSKDWEVSKSKWEKVSALDVKSDNWQGWGSENQPPVDNCNLPTAKDDVWSSCSRPGNSVNAQQQALWTTNTTANEVGTSEASPSMPNYNAWDNNTNKLNDEKSTGWQDTGNRAQSSQGWDSKGWVTSNFADRGTSEASPSTPNSNAWDNNTNKLNDEKSTGWQDTGNQAQSSQRWGSQCWGTSNFADHGTSEASPSTLNSNAWDNNTNKLNDEDTGNQAQSSQRWGSQCWGTSNFADRRTQKREYSRPPGRTDDRRGGNPNGNFSSTRRHVDSSTPEGKIHGVVTPIIQRIRKILYDSSCSDGARLPEEDQKFMIENVFQYHPDKQGKVSGQIDYITVNKHGSFKDSRCFYVVSSDGSSADFSYFKCMESFVKERFPEHAETYNRKHFKRHRSEAPNGDEQHL